MARILFILISATIVVSLGLVVFGQVRPYPEGSLEKPLKEVLPRAADFGWEQRDLPLGPTESVIDRSERLLQFDDFVHREYTRGRRAFTVYIAYWKPGAMPPRIVNQHNPSLCWVLAGWECNDLDPVVSVSAPGMDVQPAQWGEFERNGHILHTYYWHLLDGEVFRFYSESIPGRIKRMVTQPLESGFNTKREQDFLRVSSSEPLDFLWDEPFFHAVLRSLEMSGLTATRPAEVSSVN